MGADPAKVQEYAAAFHKGAWIYDSETDEYDGVLTSTKHFMGDGATYWGADQGNDTVHNFKTFIDRNIKGYIGAIDQCAGNIMCSYSAINDIPMGGNTFLLQGLLK